MGASAREKDIEKDCPWKPPSPYQTCQNMEDLWLWNKNHSFLERDEVILTTVAKKKVQTMSVDGA